ncbi:hypothetical protein EI032_20780 [Escherichia coli]|uniref:hypothetical protein n=1 Tax=Escherichia coli TaxID=562 RepID=UPI00128EC716|nr:hypothetical protein [Escherichia coli]MQI67189.1 hypothetical protein [Escherichia coli]MQI90112.1 hypothetical protein [Escherichia coli]
MKIYGVLSSDGKSLETYFGASNIVPQGWPDVVEVESSSEIYHTYYADMESKGMSYGMVTPD